MLGPLAKYGQPPLRFFIVVSCLSVVAVGFGDMEIRLKTLPPQQCASQIGVRL
jgi:hypothetical protein